MSWGRGLRKRHLGTAWSFKAQTVSSQETGRVGKLVTTSHREGLLDQEVALHLHSHCPTCLEEKREFCPVHL